MSEREIKAGKTWIEILAEDKTQKVLDRISGRFHKWGAGLSTIGAGLLAGTAGLLTTLATAAVSAGNTGDQLLDMREQTGMSVEALSELGAAARIAGTDAGALQSGLGSMAKFLTKASMGSKQATAVLDKLGVSWSQLVGMSPDERVRVLFDRIAALEDPTIRAGLAARIFGGSWQELLPLMREGAAGLEKLLQKARDAGAVTSTEDAQSGADSLQSLVTLWESAKAVVFQVGLAAGEALKPIADLLVPIVKGVRDFVKANRGLVAGLLVVAGLAAGAGVALIAVGGALSLIGMAVAGVAALPTIFAGISAVIGAIFSPVGLLVGLIVALGLALVAGVGYFLFFTETGKSMVSAIVAAFGLLWDWAKKVFGGIWDALISGDWKLAGEIAMKALYVAWLAGLLALERVWMNFKKWFLDGLHAMVDEALRELSVLTGKKLGILRNVTPEGPSDTARALADAQRDLAASIAAAAAARAKAFPDEARAGAAAAVQSASQAIGADGKSQGTFSARAAGLLSRHAGDADERTADAAEAIDEKMEDLVGLVREGGLLWS